MNFSKNQQTILKEQNLSISKLNQKTKIISRHKSTNMLLVSVYICLLIGKTNT